MRREIWYIYCHPITWCLFQAPSHLGMGIYFGGGRTHETVTIVTEYPWQRLLSYETYRLMLTRKKSWEDLSHSQSLIIDSDDSYNVLAEKSAFSWVSINAYSYWRVCSVLYTLCQLAFSGYPDWGFSVFFPQLQGKCQGIPRKDGARSALFLISELCCSMYCLCWLCCSMYCLCVNVYCTTVLPLGVNTIAVKYIISYHFTLKPQGPHAKNYCTINFSYSEIQQTQFLWHCCVKGPLPKQYIPWTRGEPFNANWIISQSSSITFCSPPTNAKLQLFSFCELSFWSTAPIDSTFHFVPSIVLYNKFTSSSQPPSCNNFRLYSSSVSWPTHSGDLL